MPHSLSTLDVIQPERLLFPFRGSLYTGADSYCELSRLYHAMQATPDSLWQLDWQQLHYLDANLSAVLAAIAHHTAGRQGNRLLMDPRQVNRPDSVFVRNGLASVLSHEGGTFFDERQSTVPVCYFTINEVDAFADYVDTKLLGHHSLRQLTTGQRDRIVSCYYELFNNVELHAQTEHVTVCGQYYPLKRLLIFTMVDFGIGFLPLVSNYTQRMNLAPVETPRDAIVWALKGGSTKTLASGGSGLQGIVKHCKATNGSIHVATSGGYFQFDPVGAQPVVYESVAKPLPGTLIHLIFRVSQ